MIFDIRSDWDADIVRSYLRTANDNNLVVGLTSGCYDLLHNLHVSYLQRCSRMCDFLIVGIDSDDLVKKTKGPERPIVPEHQRVAMVNALRCVNMVFIMGSLEDFATAVWAIKPKFIFKNQNFRPQDVIGHKESTVITVPDVFQPDSTSSIIEEIKRAKSKSEPPPVEPDIVPAPVASTPSSTPSLPGPPFVNAKAPLIERPLS